MPISDRGKYLIRKALYIRMASVTYPEYVKSWTKINGFTAKGSSEAPDYSNWDEQAIHTEVSSDQDFQLSFKVSGSGLLIMDGIPLGGIDPYHRIFDISAGKHDITVLSGSKGIFGNNRGSSDVTPVVKFIRDSALEQLYLKTITAINFSIIEGDREIFDSIEAMVDNLPPLPVHILAYEVYREYLENDVSAADIYRQLHHIADSESVVAQDNMRYIVQMDRDLEAFLGKFRKKYYGTGIIPLGHAHIDLAWLWPVSETRRKVVRSFSTVLSLMRKYPALNFVQSMAWLYRFIEEFDSTEGQSLLQNIRSEVNRGRWIPIGGMMVESDCNLISGESLVRQILYGQLYFLEKFGIRSNICWLPDTFGFTPQLPQLLSDSGYKLFFTTKLSWNDTNKFPHDLFLWKGLDGSGIAAHSHMRSYDSDISPQDLKDTLQANPETTAMGKVPIVFGYGDGGGGPTEEMIKIMKIMDPDGKTFLDGANVLGDWVAEISNRMSDLPVYNGELYLEYHRGTYTTHGDIKKANRTLESSLFVAEAMEVISSIGKTLKHTGYRPEWETVLKNQFHDILPGSSIKEVYDVAVPELLELNDSLHAVMYGKFEPDPDSISIFNPFPWNTEITVDLPKQIAWANYLESGDGYRYRIFTRIGNPEVSIPFTRGMGFYDFTAGKDAIESLNQKGDPESSHLIIGNWSIEYQGRQLSAVRYKGNELKMPEFRLFSDFPSRFDGWELDRKYRSSGLLVMPKDTELIESDNSVVVIDQTFSLEPGDMSVRYTFTDSTFCDMHFVVNWKGNNRTLRMFFETEGGKCTGEVAFGQVVRPAQDNAQFEFPAHRFVNVRGSDSSLILLNGEKYGYSYDGKYLGVTLLRSPVYPDPTADRGMNEFSFAFSAETMEDDEIHRKAQEYNIKPVVAQGVSNSSARFSIRNVMISALKISENGIGYILRVYNPTGTAKDFTIGTPFRNVRAQTCNILEELVEDHCNLTVNGDSILGHLEPFKIATIRITA